MRQFLIINGVNPNLLEVRSMVTKNQLPNNTTVQEKTFNRRVSFSVQFHEPSENNLNHTQEAREKIR